jgi:hypothetical protein
MSVATKPEPSKEPTWLVHLHYGKQGTPLTVYDNLDGTFTYMDGRAVARNVDAERALRLFTLKVNDLVCKNTKLSG